MLISPTDVIGDCVERINASYFYQPAHATIYDVLVEAWTAQRPADVITLTQILRDRNLLDAVGGPSFITHLFTFTPTAANASYYLEIVREKYVLRQIISSCTECAGRAYDEQGEVNTLLDEVEQKVLAINENRFKNSVPGMKEQVMEAIESIEKLYERRGAITGLSTGFKNFDQMTNGLHPAEMTVIAARPSMGKCLAHDAEILLADGSVATIEEIYRRGQAELLTLGEDLRLSVTQPSHFIDDGLKPVFKVTTRLGRSVESTLTHPFLTLDGWQPLADLRAGRRIAVPRKTGIFGEAEMPEAEVKILGYLLGDGGLTNACPRFTNAHPVLRADFDAAVRSLGGLVTKEEDSGGTRTMTLSVVADAKARIIARHDFAGRLRAALRTHAQPERRLARTLGIAPGCFQAWKQGRAVPEPAVFIRLCEALGIAAEALAPGGYRSIAKNIRNALTTRLEKWGLAGCNAHAKFIPREVFRLRRPLVALLLNRLFATDGRRKRVSLLSASAWCARCSTFCSASTSLLPCVAGPSSIGATAVLPGSWTSLMPSPCGPSRRRSVSSARKQPSRRSSPRWPNGAAIRPTRM